VLTASSSASAISGFAPTSRCRRPHAAPSGWRRQPRRFRRDGHPRRTAGTNYLARRPRTASARRLGPAPRRGGTKASALRLESSYEPPFRDHRALPRPGPAGVVDVHRGVQADRPRYNRALESAATISAHARGSSTSSRGPSGPAVDAGLKGGRLTMAALCSRRHRAHFVPTLRPRRRCRAGGRPRRACSRWTRSALPGAPPAKDFDARRVVENHRAARGPRGEHRERETGSRWRGNTCRKARQRHPSPTRTRLRRYPRGRIVHNGLRRRITAALAVGGGGQSSGARRSSRPPSRRWK